MDNDGKRLLEGLATVTFAEYKGKTKLTLQARAVGLVAHAARVLEGMDKGLMQSVERLAQYLTHLMGISNDTRS